MEKAIHRHPTEAVGGKPLLLASFIVGAYILNKLFSEKNIRRLFDVSLWLKSIFALFEIVAGVAAYFVTQQFLLDVVVRLTSKEFSEDPHDLVANYLLHAVQNLSITAQDFAALYLLAHGIIKLWLIVGLLRKKLWYYPTALVIFGLFVVYQLYRYAFTHSIFLLLITALDLIIIALTLHEYRYLRAEHALPQE